MFDGMSSVKEYWNRASIVEACSNFESTSSDCSTDDSNSSSNKEYCDASCNVDFDDETNELIEENTLDVTSDKLLTENANVSTVRKEDKDYDVKSSRYVRWNVLMSLGIGLWAVLCIVDVLHSEKSVTRDWLNQYIWDERSVPEVLVPKKQPTPEISWYLDFWSYLWKIVTITTSGGAYVLLFLLMIVFCADPRLRNTGNRASTKSNNFAPKISKTVENSTTVEKKTFDVEKKWLSTRFEEPERISKIVSIQLMPSMCLQRKFILSIEKCVQADFTKFDDSPVACVSSREEARVVEYFDDSRNRRNESTKCFSIDRQLVELLDMRNCEKFNVSLVNKIDWQSMKKWDSSIKDTTSLCLMNSKKSRRDLNLNASTFDLEIGEYLKRTRKSLRNTVNENLFRTNDETLNFTNFQFHIPDHERSTKTTRIITSSPAFKKFLSSFQSNTEVS